MARKVDGRRARSRTTVQVAGDAASKVDRALAEAEHELADAKLETEVAIALVDRLGSDGFRIDTEAASGVVTL